jgi:hypothetical protein
MTRWYISIEEMSILTKETTNLLIKILIQQFKKSLKIQSFGMQRVLLMKLELKKILRMSLIMLCICIEAKKYALPL